MTGLSNFKRVQNIIRERATSNKILTIISLTFASILLFTSYMYPNINYSIKIKIIDYSSHIINSIYTPINSDMEVYRDLGFFVIHESPLRFLREMRLHPKSAFIHFWALEARA